MKPRILSALLGLALSVAASCALSAESISLSQKATLQAAMQKHIERALVDGFYLQLDPETGEVHTLRPLAAHPVILRMGKFFVLCADFRTTNGQNVNIDFFLAPKGDTYFVFDDQLENRALLKRLARVGKVEAVD